MLDAVELLATDAGGAGGGVTWQTVLAVLGLLFGTGGTSVALITSIAGRKKMKADTSQSLVNATAQILGPYSTAIEMQKDHIKELIEREKLTKRELRVEIEKRRQLEVRVRDLEAKVQAYERLHGPLVTP